jgi:hypothetical protein
MHLLDSPDLEMMTRRIVCVIEWTVGKQMIGTFTIHLISILLWIVLIDPRAGHGKYRTRALFRWLESGLVVQLAVFETRFLCTSNPFESVSEVLAKS